MSTKTISNFKFETWGSLEVETDNDHGRHTTTKWYDVSKCVLKKIIDCKKPPTVDDIDKWIKADKDKRSSGIENVAIGYANWWEND